MAIHLNIKCNLTAFFFSLLFSAGIGRTGTYVVLDNVLDQIEAESVVDIDGVIVRTRQQRMKMVQTKVSKHKYNDCVCVCVSGIVKLKMNCKQDCLFICGG